MLPYYHSEPIHAHYVLVPHYSFYTGAGIIDGRDSAAVATFVAATLVADRICNTNRVTLASDISKINENNRHVRRIYGNKRSNT
jgi:chorismate synthase